MMEIQVQNETGEWVTPPPDQLRRMNHEIGIDDEMISDLEAIRRDQPYGDLVKTDADGRRVQPDLTDDDAL